MRYKLVWMALSCLVLLPAGLHSQEESNEAQTHKDLIALRDGAVEALNKQDVDGLLKFVHPQLVFTAPYPEAGKEVRRGPAGFKAYYDELFTGPNRRATGMTTEVKVDDTSILYGGDTAIAWGSSRDTYHMLDGSDFVVPSRWSGTLVREDGRWLIAEFHVSVNMFNNPLMGPALQKTAWAAGGIAGVVGLLLGAGAVLLLGRRTPATNAGSRL